MGLMLTIGSASMVPSTAMSLGASGSQFVDLYITGTAFIDSIGESIIFADNIAFTFGTGTGIKLGVATNNKIGFFNATPVTQRVATADIRQSLIDLGFIATGGATPLNLNGGALVATGNNTLGATLISGAVSMSDVNFVFSTGTGTTIATGTNQKLAFYGAVPVVQQASLTAGETSITFTAPTTPDYAIADLSSVDSFGFVSADEGQTILQVIQNLQARVTELESRLTAYGLLSS